MGKKEDEDALDEREIGNRLFRKLADGQIVEVLDDGTVEREYTVGGRNFDSQTAGFGSMARARENLIAEEGRGPDEARGLEAPKPEEKPQPKKGKKEEGESTDEQTMEDKVKEYLQSDQATGDERLKGLKRGSSVVFSGSIKDLLNEAPKGNAMGGSHSVGGTHQMASGTAVASNREDPFKRVLENARPTSFKEHMEKLAAARRAQSGSVRTSSPQSAAKSSSLTLKNRTRSLSRGR